LDSAKPGQIKLSDQSAAKQTDDGYQGKGVHVGAYVKFHLKNYVCR